MGISKQPRLWARLQIGLHKLSARPHHWRQHLHNALKMEKVRQGVHRTFTIIFWSLIFCKEQNLKVSITRWNMDSDSALFRFREYRSYSILRVQVIVFHTGQSLWDGPFSCLASVNALTSTEHISLWSLPVLTQLYMGSTVVPRTCMAAPFFLGYQSSLHFLSSSHSRCWHPCCDVLKRFKLSF